MLTLCLTPMLLSLALPQAQEERNMKKMIEDVEIMRRVLLTRMQSAAGQLAGYVYYSGSKSFYSGLPGAAPDVLVQGEARKEVEKGDAGLNGKGSYVPPIVSYYTNLNAPNLAGANQNLRKPEGNAFFIPQMGAFFTLDVTVRPVWKEVPTDGEQKDEEEEDLWEQVRSRVQTGAKSQNPFETLLNVQTAGPASPKGTVRSSSSKQVTWDPAAVDAAQRIVFDTIAKHGHRMDQLQSSEEIVVVLRITTANNLRLFAESHPLLSKTMGSRSPGTLHIALRFSRELVRDRAEDLISFEQFKKRVVVTRY